MLINTKFGIVDFILLLSFFIILEFNMTGDLLWLFDWNLLITFFV